ncbi:MAG: hypothetical protein IJY54_05170 [Paludibacteraceae bacterium]|nr:hypothetical protein [Paludibacteraceae bacterium]
MNQNLQSQKTAKPLLVNFSTHRRVEEMSLLMKATKSGKWVKSGTVMWSDFKNVNDDFKMI